MSALDLPKVLPRFSWLGWGERANFLGEAHETAVVCFRIAMNGKFLDLAINF